eukprot:2348298-Pleurochrysis_carterae.AAC.1
MKPTTASGGHHWALVHVTAIKDAQARGKPTPMPVASSPADGRAVRRRCALHLRRAAHSVGGARAH